MLTESRLDCLNSMYRLFGRVPTGHPEMKRALRGYILDQCRDINERFAPSHKSRISATDNASTLTSAGKSDPIQWFQAVLAVHAQVDSLFRRAFSQDKEFLKTMEDAMLTILNENVRFPEYVSLFLDSVLRSGVKGVCYHCANQALL